MGLWARAVFAVTLPLAVFLGGAWLLTTASGRSQVPAPPVEARPLNQRLGYSATDVGEYWRAFDAAGLAAERRMLELDLVFPFAYGGALAAGLLAAWAGLGRGFNPAWIIGLVGIGVLADWTENLVQLAQMERFARDGPQGLQAAWIAVASAATVAKLVSLALASLALVALVVAMLAWRRS